jgi:hypothetical protein
MIKALLTVKHPWIRHVIRPLLASREYSLSVTFQHDDRSLYWGTNHSDQLDVSLLNSRIS